MSQEDYITQVSEEIEGRVTKKLSQELSRTKKPQFRRAIPSWRLSQEPAKSGPLPNRSGDVPECIWQKPGNAWGPSPKWSSSWSRYLSELDYTQPRPRRWPRQYCYFKTRYKVNSTQKKTSQWHSGVSRGGLWTKMKLRVYFFVLWGRSSLVSATMIWSGFKKLSQPVHRYRKYTKLRFCVRFFAIGPLSSHLLHDRQGRTSFSQSITQSNGLEIQYITIFSIVPDFFPCLLYRSAGTLYQGSQNCYVNEIRKI